MTAPLLVSVPTTALRDALAPTETPVELILWDLTEPIGLDHVDIVVPPYMGSASRLANLAGLSTRLIQSQSIGFNGVAEVLPPGQVFANAAGVHEASTAELTVGLVLAAQRGIDQFVRDALDGRWRPRDYASLADRRILLVGVGGVGRAIAARLAPFEVDVVRVASRARHDDDGEVYGIDALGELLPTAEIVIVVVPLTASTHHLIDERFLAAMPDGALLVNVSRGAVADTAALLRHASAGRLRLALDVVDPEPLPDDHPLFALSNVLISPHVGGATTAMLPRMARLLADQIDRLGRGEEPRNVVLRT